MKKDNLWKKKALAFITSQAVSLFGSSIVQMAIVWYVTMQTSSGIWLTILTLSSFLPQMIISPFAGVWADRYNKKKIIIFADVLIAVSTLILAIFLQINNLANTSLIAIVVVSIIRSIGTGIQTPTVNSMIPLLVPEDKLMKFNGVNSSIQSVIQFASPLVAGGILVLGSISNILFIDVITAVIGVSILSFIKIEQKFIQKTEEKASTINDIKEGIRFSISDKLIGKLLLIYGIFIFLSVPSSFMSSLIITRNFGQDYMYLSICETIGFVGMFLGGLLLGTWGGFKNRNKTLTLGMILYSIFAIGLGLVTQYWMFVALIFFISFSIPIIQTTTMTMLQEKVQIEMQGRIFSLLNAIFSGLMPLGMILFGVLADIVSINYLIIPAGAILLLIGILMFKSFYKEGIANN